MSIKKHIAIIGGGAVGPLLLAYISKEAQKQSALLKGITFHLIDPKGFGSGGIAYGECQPNHALNSVCAEMAPYQESAFKNYLEDIGHEVEDDKFYSRSLYKEFIKTDLVQKPISTLKDHGAKFIEHKAYASIKKGKNGFKILDQNNNLISPELDGLKSDEVILTVGYGPNSKFLAFKDHPGFIQNIYDKNQKTLLEREARLNDKSSKVAVIGSGPGLYDIVNELPHNYARFLVISSAGKGLDVRDVSLEKEEQSIPPHNLLSLGKHSSLQDALSALQKEFSLAAQGRSKRRIALDIQKHVKSILLSLNSKVALQFKHSAEFLPIKHLATPIPMTSKEKLDKQSPTFIKGRLKVHQIQSNADGSFDININDQVHKVDVIINATGHGRHNSPILELLKRDGLVRVSPATNSLETDGSGYRTIPSNLPVIGAATHVGCDGMESFAVYAEHCAKSLIEEIKKSNAIDYSNDLEHHG